MRLSNRRRGTLLAALAGVFLIAYGWYVSLFEKKPVKTEGGSKISQAACDDTTAQSAETKNPNIKLFISCGGFLE